MNGSYTRVRLRPRAPEGRVQVVEDDATPVPEGVIQCVLGRDLQIHYGRLERYCLRSLQQNEVDLLVLAAAVAYADRSVRRQRGSGWARDLHVTVPVHLPECWTAVAHSRLVEALQFLTGDRWQFAFVARRHRDERALQLFLPIETPPPTVVLPYSGGLDSYAELVRLLVADSAARPFLVTARQGSAHDWLVRQTVAATGAPTRCYQVGVPVSLAAGNHAEPTYRTRTFKFFVLAAVACRVAGAERIVVSENGQGALGPSVVPFGGEHPYRSTHPGFTRRMQAFLAALWGTAPMFEHPHLWSTKATVLRSLEGELGRGSWNDTRSCGRNVRREKGVGGLPDQCGVCGGCLLRRLSARSARFEEPDERASYVWHDLGSRRLDQAVGVRSAIRTTQNDEVIATYAVLSHKHLATAAELDDDALGLAAYEAAEGAGIAEGLALTQLRGLLHEHRAEWRAFVGALPEQSWVAQLAGEA